MKMLITVDGKAYHVEVEILDAPTTNHAPTASLAQPDPSIIPSPTAPPANETGEIESPIAGNVAEVLVKPGDAVAAGEILVVLEVMKMESNVAAPLAGTVKSVNVKPGDTVKRHDILVEF